MATRHRVPTSGPPGVAGALAVLVAAAVAVAACAGAGSPTQWTPAGPGVTPVVSMPSPASAGANVVEAFLALTQAQSRAMHVDATAVVTFAGMDETLTAAYDVRGPDYAGTTTVDVPNVVHQAIHVVVVGGVAFSRTDDGPWAGTATSPPPQDPFAGLQASDVTYDGPVDIAGEAGHRLVLRDPLVVFTRAMGVTNPEGMGDVTVASATYEVLVDADARPVSAAFTLAGTSAAAGEIQVRMDYAFRDWGGTFTITAPFDAPPPAPGAVLTAYNRLTRPIVLRDGSGQELAVAACDVASADVFDPERFDVLLATGEMYDAVFPSPDQGWTTHVVVVTPQGMQQQPDPLVSELPPCGDYAPGS